MGLIPGMGTKIPHAVQKKKRKNGVNNSFYLIRSVQTLSGIIHVNNNGLIIINNNDLTLLTNLIMTF